MLPLGDRFVKVYFRKKGTEKKYSSGQLLTLNRGDRVVDNISSVLVGTDLFGDLADIFSVVWHKLIRLFGILGFGVGAGAGGHTYCGGMSPKPKSGS